MPAGFGRHMWDVTATQLPAYLNVSPNPLSMHCSIFYGLHYSPLCRLFSHMLTLAHLQLLLVLALTYIWPPTLTKLAILVLYWRINPSYVFRGCVLATAAALVGYTAVFTALFGGPCNPLATGSGACLNNIAVAQAVLNIVTDAVIIALPIPVIHRLNMPLKQRIQVGIILALGSAYVSLPPLTPFSIIA